MSAERKPDSATYWLGQAHRRLRVSTDVGAPVTGAFTIVIAFS